MPYSKRNNYRRKYRRMNRSKTTVRRIAHTEAKKVISKSVETKFYDAAIVAQAVDTNGLGTNLNLLADPFTGTNITQGTGESDYLGQRISPVFIQIRGTFGNADNFNTYRVVVLQSRTDILPTGALTWLYSGTVVAPFSPRQPQFDKTFRILADKTYQTYQTAQNGCKFKINVPANRISDVYFRDTVGTVERGLLSVLIVSDSAGVGHPFVSMAWRVLYKDA